MVEYDGGRYHRHVNALRPCTTRNIDAQTDSVSCNVEEVDVPNVGVCSVNVDNNVDVVKVVGVEPNNCHSTHSTTVLSSENISRDKLAHLSSLQSRRLSAVSDEHLDMCIDCAEQCEIVRHTVELLTDDSAAQSKPPLCGKQADTQSTVAWPCKFTECVECPPAAPTVIFAVAARCESDARSALVPGVSR